MIRLVSIPELMVQLLVLLQLLVVLPLPLPLPSISTLAVTGAWYGLWWTMLFLLWNTEAPRAVLSVPTLVVRLLLLLLLFLLLFLLLLSVMLLQTPISMLLFRCYSL